MIEFRIALPPARLGMTADYESGWNPIVIFGGQGLGDLFYYSILVEGRASYLTPSLFLNRFNFPVGRPVTEGKR